MDNLMRETHNGAIKTSALAPDSVWYSCDVYNLPDNTVGCIGYHVVYRPLCKPYYTGTEVVTDKMMEDTRAHYRIIERLEKNEAAATEEESNEIDKIYAKRRANGLCPHCGTYCYGDCRANQ